MGGGGRESIALQIQALAEPDVVAPEVAGREPGPKE